MTILLKVKVLWLVSFYTALHCCVIYCTGSRSREEEMLAVESCFEGGGMPSWIYKRYENQYWCIILVSALAMTGREVHEQRRQNKLGIFFKYHRKFQVSRIIYLHACKTHVNLTVHLDLRTVPRCVQLNYNCI